MKQINYSLTPREDILQVLPSVKGWNVLDVGCAIGVMGQALKRLGARYVVGIEVNTSLAEQAKRYMDRVYRGDVEKLNIPYKKNYFDLIICADVIEHLKNPEKFLEVYLKLLKRNGYFLLSVPNVRYYYVLWSLLRGEWKYSERGIFDRTHLRFFTLKSIKRLLHNRGLVIVKINRNYRLREPYCLHQRLAKYISLYILRDFFTFQYVILTRKDTS